MGACLQQPRQGSRKEEFQVSLHTPKSRLHLVYAVPKQSADCRQGLFHRVIALSGAPGSPKLSQAQRMERGSATSLSRSYMYT